MTPGPYNDLGKMLLIFGVALVIAGAFLLTGAKLPFRLGRLPGDIAYQGKNGSFYFPIVTCILLSVALTLISGSLIISAAEPTNHEPNFTF